jgi:hypothetical protein
MQSFVCDFCKSTLFFENDTCLSCGRKVGFRTDEMTMSTVGAAAAAGIEPCRNWTQFNACNWFALRTDTESATGEDSGYCRACSLNEVVPDLSEPQRLALWVETERAKRHLIYTLLQLRLPLGGVDGKEGLRFRLLADERVDTGAMDPPNRNPVYIGHDSGCLTVNVVEADHAHREAMRKHLNEPYRTMLGHLRHETGHYYWYLLVAETPRLPGFRELFGDERADYAEALEKHYSAGASDAWQQSFVSSYASAHPWEDFAETWAHYIHIVDTLDTASDSAIALRGRAIMSPLPLSAERSFTAILDDWLPLSVCLNQLNRSMGMRDAYPFALTNRVIHKLSFVHGLCLEAPYARQTGYASHDPLPQQQEPTARARSV